MRVLVTGDRDWWDSNLIFAELDQLEPDVVIHGAARGADVMAGDWARLHSVVCISVPAQWNKHGRAAGPIRNQEMLAYSPDFVLAFHDDIDHSRGTADMIRRATVANLRVKLVSHRPEAI